MKVRVSNSPPTLSRFPCRDECEGGGEEDGEEEKEEEEVQEEEEA